MTTLHVRQDELRTAVDPYPGVLRVSTDADFPHRLRIAVHERNPIGAVVAGSQRVPVAADGTLMRTTPSAGLPAIAAKALPGGSHASDTHVRRAIEVLAAAPPALRARVRRVYVGDRGWTLPLRNGPILYLGDSARLAAKWAAVVDRPRRPDLDRRDLPRRPPSRAAGGGRSRAAPGPGRAADDRERHRDHDHSRRRRHRRPDPDLTLYLGSRVASDENLLQDLRVLESARNLARVHFR